MGVTDEHTAMDEAGKWPADLHFRKVRHRRTGRSQSPCRDVSPVPSHYSEPVSVRQRKDVTLGLPPLIRGAHREEEDDDEDDTQSLKSLPTVMSTLAFDPKVKRSHRLPKAQVISGLNLPTLVTSKCTLVVNGTGYTRARGFLPAIKSRSLERPPCRAGRRLDQLESSRIPHAYSRGQSQNASIDESHCSEKTGNNMGRKQILPSDSAVLKVGPGPRITFHSPVVQAVYPITPNTMKETEETVKTRHPRRPVLKKAQPANRRSFHFLWEESYIPSLSEPHLLEPLSSFKEHLRHQILNSPLPCQGPPAHVHSRVFLHQRDSPTLHPYKAPMDRTVELCESQGKRLPKITMTCPTPSPKELHCTQKRTTGSSASALSGENL